MLHLNSIIIIIITFSHIVMTFIVYRYVYVAINGLFISWIILTKTVSCILVIKNAMNTINIVQLIYSWCM